MEEQKSDNVDEYNQVQELKCALDCKRMIFSKNCIKVSMVIGQGIDYLLEDSHCKYVVQHSVYSLTYTYTFARRVRIGVLWIP